MSENLYYYGFVEGYAAATFIAIYTSSTGSLLFGLSCLAISTLLYNAFSCFR